MNFFQSQDAARTNTKRLVVFFILAVISLIVITNLLVMFLFGYLDTAEQQGSINRIATQFDWEVFLTIGAVVVTVVLAGSAYKTIALSGGGETVAESLGGRRIDQSTRNLHERKVLNVVEEMAIASGSPVPTVYLLDNEEGINAFAAGYSGGDAVIGVTRGTINLLTREELQGVIAHEFSHILNGDMRLNIRLIAILHGILLLGIIGYFLLRSSGGRSKNAGAIVGLGLGLVVIGYAGTFFGNLIKASVSRQREFLADASAVQFTRNNTGIAGALKKIGGYSFGSKLESPNAPSMSHAYFSNGVTSMLGSLSATHPPLEVRIKRIEPTWDGKFITAVQEVEDKSEETIAESKSEQFKKVIAGAMVANEMLSSNIVDHIGQANLEQINYAAILLSQLPETLKNAAHEPYGARAIIYCLVLNNDRTIQQKQFQHLKEFADDGIYELCGQLFSEMASLEIKFRLPLIDMTLPSLRQLSASQYDLFKRNLLTLIKADNKIDIFEWALQRIVFRNLDLHFGLSNKVKAANTSLKAAKPHVELLLSLLAEGCSENRQQLEENYAAAQKELDIKDLKLVSRDKLTVENLSRATDALAHLKPLQKPQLLKACLVCMTQDNNYSAFEKELMRAIANTLDCPMPLFVE